MNAAFVPPWKGPRDLPPAWSTTETFPYRYPFEIERWVSLRSGQRVLVRVARPGDLDGYQRIFDALAPGDIRSRFMGIVARLPQSEVRRLEDVNYSREIILVASALDSEGRPDLVGINSGLIDPQRSSVEFGLVVRSDYKGLGLGRILLQGLIHCARLRGLAEVRAEVLRGNHPMMALMRSLGFRCPDDVDDGDEEQFDDEDVSFVLHLMPPKGDG